MYEFEVIWWRDGTTLSQTVYIDTDMIVEIALDLRDSAFSEVDLSGYDIKVIQAT